MCYRLWNRCFKSLSILLLTLLTVSLGVAEEPEYRTFTNKEGKQIKATVLEIAGTDVTIKVKSGKKFKLSIATLSEADQAYLKTWKKPIGELLFDIKCTKKPAAEASPNAVVDVGSSKTRSKGYCYEVSLTNKGFDSIPGMEVRYALYKSTSGNTQRGISIRRTGQGKFTLPKIERLKSVSGLTDPVFVTLSKSSSSTLLSDGTEDRTYTKTREGLAGIKLELWVDDQLVKTHSHGRVGEDKVGKVD